MEQFRLLRVLVIATFGNNKEVEREMWKEGEKRRLTQRKRKQERK
jgi:hypothetical protein